MQIFLTNSKRERERSNPSSPRKLPSKRKNISLQEGCTTLAQAFTKKYHQEAFSQERDTKNAQEGANFSQYVFSQWESYDPNEIELISIYTKCSKTCLSTILRVKHKIRGQHPLPFPLYKSNII
jgi:hypothetical protein